jgi:hypothetical protein
MEILGLIQENNLRKTISLALMLLMAMSSIPAASGEDNVATQIATMPAGAKMELHLKNNQTLRGARGPVSNVGFTLVDARNGEHQIAFDDVASVKQLKSHTTRNILIGVGIGVAALGITAGILLRCGPLGCGNRIGI